MIDVIGQGTYGTVPEGELIAFEAPGHDSGTSGSLVGIHAESRNWL